MYPPGFLIEGARARDRELERKAQRKALLTEIKARQQPRPNPLRIGLLYLGRLLENSGTRLQQAAGYPASSSQA